MTGKNVLHRLILDLKRGLEFSPEGSMLSSTGLREWVGRFDGGWTPRRLEPQVQPCLGVTETGSTILGVASAGIVL